MRQALPAPANSNVNTDGLWMSCACGRGLFGVKLDEKTGFKHLICDHCGADRTMEAFG